MERWELEQSVALPLGLKIIKTQQRIREWYAHFRGNVFVSFSGGKDSTVLLDLVRKLYKDVSAVFCDTGLEYPEIRKFVLSFDNVHVIRPKLSFKEVLNKYGYPVVTKEQAQYIYDVHHSKSEKLRDIRMNGSLLPDGTRGSYGFIKQKWKFLIDAPFEISDRCCYHMKKFPFKKYVKESDNKPMTGEMVGDSVRRRSSYLTRGGCNGFQLKEPKSTPMGFWTEQDVLEYLCELKVPYCDVYGDIVRNQESNVYKTTGVSRTGCMFCMFGVQYEKEPNRFQLMKSSHPRLYKYCIEDLGVGKVLDYIKVRYD